MATNNVAKTNRTAGKKAAPVKDQTPAASTETVAETRKERTLKIQAKFPGLMMSAVTVIGGRKLEEGTKAECIWVGANKYFQETARLLLKDGSTAWVQPKFLKIDKPLSDARKAALEAQREEEKAACLLMPAVVKDQSHEKSVLLSYSGFHGPIWFPKTDVQKVGETANGLIMFEVPVWKIRQMCGASGVEHLESKQEAFKASIAS